MGIGLEAGTSIHGSFTEFRPPQWAEQIAIFLSFQGPKALEKKKKTGTPKGVPVKKAILK